MKWNEIDPIQSDIVYFQLLIRDGPWQCKRVPDKLEKPKKKKKIHVILNVLHFLFLKGKIK